MYLGQGRVSMSMGQVQGHTSVTRYTHVGGLPLTEKQVPAEKQSVS